MKPALDDDEREKRNEGTQHNATEMKETPK